MTSMRARRGWLSRDSSWMSLSPRAQASMGYRLALATDSWMSKRFVELAITATPDEPRPLRGRRPFTRWCPLRACEYVHLVTEWLMIWDESLSRAHWCDVQLRSGAGP